MKIPNGYLQAEVRDGFYVSSKMKRTWAATLEVFKEVEKVCQKYNITYYADWGTLLGAIRHKGFIPWDDDFDICMKRSDYMRFIDVAKYELPEDYSLLNIHNESEYDDLMTRVVNRKTISFGRKYLERFHGFPYIVGIDIFPLDYVPDDEKKRQDLIDEIRYIGGLIDAFDCECKDIKIKRKEIYELTMKHGFSIENGKPIRQQLLLLVEKIISQYSENDYQTLVTIPFLLNYPVRVIPTSYYENTIRVPFEYTDIVVPLLYDCMLEKKYRNYIECIREWDSHNYPVYAELENTVHMLTNTSLWREYGSEKLEQDIKESYERYVCKEKAEYSSEVVFIPYRAEKWIYMEPLFNEFVQDHNMKTVVMPVPYYEKNCMGELETCHYDFDIFEQYMEVTRYEDYDFATRRPKCIVIQVPYDEYDTSISVLPFFYSKNLKNYTDELIYVPDFYLDEYSAKDERAFFNMNFFCVAPGVINADIVYVQSENMRERYIDKLISVSGEKSRDMWEKKITVINWDIVNEEQNGVDISVIPNEWLPYLCDTKGNFKKLILYYTSVSRLYEYKEAYLGKIRSDLEKFISSGEEVTVIWYVDPAIFMGDFPYEDNELCDAVVGLVEKYEKCENIIVDYEHDDIVVAMCDEFYGDRGELMHRFDRTGRPIVIEEVDV